MFEGSAGGGAEAGFARVVGRRWCVRITTGFAAGSGDIGEAGRPVKAMVLSAERRIAAFAGGTYRDRRRGTRAASVADGRWPATARVRPGRGVRRRIRRRRYLEYAARRSGHAGPARGALVSAHRYGISVWSGVVGTLGGAASRSPAGRRSCAIVGRARTARRRWPTCL